MIIPLHFRLLLPLASLLAVPAVAVDVPGAIEPGYVVSLGVGSYLSRMAVYPGMKLLIEGTFNSVNGVAKKNIARLALDGSVDGAFDTSAIYIKTPSVVLPGGKIFVGAGRIGGTVPSSFLGLLNPDGSEDSSATTVWNISGYVYCPAVQSDGKIVMVGKFTMRDGVPQVNVARVMPDGSWDKGFAVSTNSDVNAVAIQSDGKILIAGKFTVVNGEERNRIARLNTDGSVEALTTFKIGKGADGEVHALAVQPDGRILLGGGFHNFNGALRMHIARLSTDGSLEGATAFNTGAFTKADTRGGPQYDAAAVESITLQADGRILVTGTFDHVKGMLRPHVARLMPDGVPETKATFDPRYVAETRKGATARPSIGEMFQPRVVLQGDGRMIIGGASLTGPNSRNTENHIVRMGNYPATETLTAPNGTTVLWMRGGSAPEVSIVHFDVSVDNGVTWKPLGPGTRVRGGWQCGGLSVPASGLLRATGSVPSGGKTTWPGIMDKVVPFILGPPPRKL